jgi:ABC-2 type transport system ATP-binding protein
VVGANGAGKSTFLRICAGLISPDRGDVLVNGSIGYCPQTGGMLDFLRPDEHFALFGRGRGLSQRVAVKQGRELAAMLDWEPDRKTQTRHLSGGTRQKLNVVLALLGGHDILLMDEPYQGFDKGSYTDFWQVIWRERDAGRAVVVITHMLNTLDRVDQVLDLTPVGDEKNR